MTDILTIAGKSYSSRLIIGTGKYKSYAENAAALEASGAEIVTVAVRRVNFSDPSKERLTDFIDPKKTTFLPNTAGCFTADEAVRTLRLAREAGDWKLVKLEVLADQKTLYPDMEETLKAAKLLIAEGFEVMVYCSDDPVYAKKLEDAGCVAIMPLGSLIGSGLGVQNPVNIRLIVEQARVPVIVDAGVGTASDAAIAMELGVRRRPDEHRHRRSERSHPHGARDEARRDRRARSVSRGADGEEEVRRSIEPVGWADLTHDPLPLAGERGRQRLLPRPMRTPRQPFRLRVRVCDPLSQREIEAVEVRLRLEIDRRGHVVLRGVVAVFVPVAVARRGDGVARIEAEQEAHRRHADLHERPMVGAAEQVALGLEIGAHVDAHGARDVAHGLAQR